jgi:hypothetical protein
MNKTLESIRGSWLTRDSEVAKASSNCLRQAVDKIPVELRDSVDTVIDWAERNEEWNDLIIECAAKNSAAKFEEIQFIETQIKGLIDAIRATKDVESIKALRTVARETIERMSERKHREELKRLDESMKFQTSLPTNPKTS